MKTKFVHIRPVDSSGKVLGNGGITVAFETDDSGYIQRSAAAICHPRDNFSRYMGRVKASGRLNSAKWRVDYMDVTVHEKDFIKNLRENGLEEFQNSSVL